MCFKYFWHHRVHKPTSVQWVALGCSIANSDGYVIFKVLGCRRRCWENPITSWGFYIHGSLVRILALSCLAHFSRVGAKNIFAYWLLARVKIENICAFPRGFVFASSVLVTSFENVWHGQLGICYTNLSSQLYSEMVSLTFLRVVHYKYGGSGFKVDFHVVKNMLI